MIITRLQMIRRGDKHVAHDQQENRHLKRAQKAAQIAGNGYPHGLAGNNETCAILWFPEKVHRGQVDGNQNDELQVRTSVG